MPSERTVPFDALTGNGHLVHFYDDPSSLFPTAAQFLHGGLSAGRVVIVVAIEEHRQLLEANLSRLEIDLDTARHEGRYLTFDAHDTLCSFMVNDWPNEARFMRFFSKVIDSTGVLDQSSPIRVFGEMVTVLWNEGKREAAVEVEKLWNQLITRYAFSVLCAYPLRNLEAGGDHYLKICDVHSGTCTPGLANK